MQLALVLLPFALVGCSAASAGQRRHVLCFGDSNTVYGSDTGTNYAQLLAKLRPELDVTFSGVIGERTTEGVPRILSLLDQGACPLPCTLVLFEAVNDPFTLFQDARPDRVSGGITARRLLRVARKAERKYRVNAMIFTMLRTKVRPPTNPYPFDFEAFGGELSRYLLAQTRIQIADVRSLWTDEEWAALSFDRVHLTSIESREAVAALISRLIDEKDSVRR